MEIGEASQAANTVSSKMVRRMLGLDLPAWNTLMWLSLGLAAFAAIAIFLTTRAVISLQDKEATDRADELAKYKQDASVRIAEANAKALEAQLALAKYRAGRSLTDEQKSALHNALGHSPKGPVVIKPNFLSAEPTRYANELSAVFNSSGFSDVGDKPLLIVATNKPGIFVAIRDRQHPPPQFDGIVEALQMAKIPFTAHEEVYVPDVNTVVILVGEQP